MAWWLIIIRPLLLWICNWFDRWILWSYSREKILQTTMGRKLFFSGKYLLHSLSGQSELKRVLVNVIKKSKGTTTLSKLNGTNAAAIIMPSYSSKNLVLVEEILCNSKSLQNSWRRITSLERVDGQIISQICRQIAIRKVIPIKGMMFKILMDFLTRIVGKLSLVKRVNYMQRVNFDEKNPIHLSLLSRLWIGLKGKKEDTPPPPIPNERWKELGFQGTNPGTDFRGVGLFGLEQLVYFAEVDGNKNRSIYEEAQYGPYWYSFSVVSLNVTNLIVTLLKAGQLDSLLYNSFKFDMEEPSSSLFILYKIYNDLLVNFHYAWMAAKPDNLFAFNSIFDKVKSQFYTDNINVT